MFSKGEARRPAPFPNSPGSSIRGNTAPPPPPRVVQASDSSLLSRLISICSEGRLSSRLFFILWVRRSCFCLIMAPHILCSVESSSSSPRLSSSSSLSPSPSPRLLSLLLLPPPSRPDEEEENSPAERPLDLS